MARLKKKLVFMQKIKIILILIGVFFTIGKTEIYADQSSEKSASEQTEAQDPDNIPWWQQENPPYFDASRWEESIQAFEAQDKASPPPENAIVAVGSSSILYWHDRIQDDLAPLTIIPRGFGGSTTKDADYMIDRIVIPYKPRAVLYYEGDNDIGAFDIAPKQVLDTFISFKDKLHQALPDTRIYVIAIKPSLARWDKWSLMFEANSLLKKHCAQDERLTYIDIAGPMLSKIMKPKPDLFVDDGLHLNENGYDVWTETIRPILLDGEAQYEAEE